MENTNGTQGGDALQRPRETFEGSRGPLPPPSWATRNKQSEWNGTVVPKGNCGRTLGFVKRAVGEGLFYCEASVVTPDVLGRQ
jgi:hypothetical protein